MTPRFPYLPKKRNTSKEEKLKDLHAKILKIKNQMPYEVRISDEKYNNLIRRADQLIYGLHLSV